ncbi:Hypothetical_protein [Hexamita inflata]|uniref:Hypothetical_protein n=1 Tax=Hexamita inflata TaxID=28002 RepID=A0AA86U821_9EUKA|nr:Hypothetical protein HINF_LOCUS20793 [Hexamita inflata]
MNNEQVNANMHCFFLRQINLSSFFFKFPFNRSLPAFQWSFDLVTFRLGAFSLSASESLGFVSLGAFSSIFFAQIFWKLKWWAKQMLNPHFPVQNGRLSSIMLQLNQRIT